MEWAGIILVNTNGEILLNLRDDSPTNSWPNCWDVIGGTVEDSETPDECILREMHEETGETLTAVDRFKAYDVPLQNGGVAKFHVYSGRLDKPACELILGEGQAHRFFSTSELDRLNIARGTDVVLRDFVASSTYKALRP